MWQNCQSESFQHNETNTVSTSLPVYCHSSSYRYFKFDFKTLCFPMMPEDGFSCQQWRHYWRWKCVQCTCEMQELRRGRVPLLTNWVIDLCDPANTMAVHVTQAHWQLGEKLGTWEEGTAERHLVTCLRASVAHDTVAVHPLQSNSWSGLEIFHSILRFHAFVFFRFCIILFHFHLCTFLHCRFCLRIHYFVVNGYFRVCFR